LSYQPRIHRAMESEYEDYGAESPSRGGIYDHGEKENIEPQQKKRRREVPASHGEKRPHGEKELCDAKSDIDPSSNALEAFSDDDYDHPDMQYDGNHGNTSGDTRKRKPERSCWLCEYQGNRTTNEVIRFIMEGIPHMALDSLITQSKYLLDRVDIGSDCSISQIKTHVTSHMLHPRIKLALQLQNMVKMQEEVSKCCVVDDVEAGGKTINPQAMRVYLTLCTQVSSVYKMGEDKLTFNQASAEK
jgi:hypothetical protein